jgi:hypothetical protein
MTLQPLWTVAAFQSPDLFTIDRTPWTSEQLLARPLPKRRATQTRNKYIYTPNIHALSGIGTHGHGVQASEDSSCFRPLSYRDRQPVFCILKLELFLTWSEILVSEERCTTEKST